MMRIRNKHTGEIVTWEHGPSYRLGKEYHSLAEFNADWEDAPSYFTDKQIAAIRAFMRANDLNCANVERVRLTHYTDPTCVSLMFCIDRANYSFYEIELAGKMPLKDGNYSLFELGLEAKNEHF